MRTDLAALVGSDNVASGVPVADASGLSATAAVLVTPGDAHEVAAVVAWCCERGVPVVPVGGCSGYAGGCVPEGEAVCLALDRLNRIRSFDPALMRMEAEAGVRTATIHRRAREEGLRFPPDPGAAEQSQLGGNIACNAGGPHAYLHGATGAWVTGLEAVLAPGELVRVGGPVRKDVAGYDLRGLLIGSEGTLGVITAAWLRLTPAPEAELPVLGLFADARTGCDAVASVPAASGARIGALEFFDARSLAAAPLAGAQGAAFALLVEVEGAAGEAVRDREAVEIALREAGATAVVRPDDPGALWRWRDGVSIAVTAQLGAKLSEDVAVPVERLADVVLGTLEIGARHGLDACSWGHAGDGNVHATFLLEPGDVAMRSRAETAARELFDLAIALGGTISGEHGLGVLKNGWLSTQWRPAAVAAHRAVKVALDPGGVMNPGKKLP